jgi:nucleotide-binding universal stress UspA family protein
MSPQVATRLALKHILFATDFSAVSDAALPFAVALAKRFDSTVHAFHVLTHGELPPTPEAAPVIMKYDLQDAGEQLMTELLRADCWEGVPHDGRISSGAEIWNEIAAVIEADNIDLVVLGTHGREGLKQWVLGSVAETVFRSAPCPVLVVGPRTLARTPVGFRTLLFATDLGPESLKALPFVQAFAADNDAKLLVMHISQEKVQDRAEQVLAEESQLRWMQELIPPQRNVEHHVLFGSTADNILEVAATRQCDLIMLGAHHASRFATHVPGAVAHRIVSEARCPVLTVHWNEKGPAWY